MSARERQTAETEDAMDALERLLSRPEAEGGTGGPSPWTLARLAAGELAAEEARSVAAAAAGSPAAAERLRRLREAEAAFERERPFSGARAELERRAARLPANAQDDAAMRGIGVSAAAARPVLPAWLRNPRWLAAAGLPLLALGIGILATRPHGGGRGAQPDAADAVDTADTADASGVRRKGGAALAAARLVDGRPESLEAGSTVTAGDRIQFSVSSPHSNIVLLGVDGSGTVSRYLPVAGETSAPWLPGQPRPLPDSLLLDDAPGPEVFLAFLSDDPLLVEDLERALHEVVSRGGGPRAALSADWQARGLAPQVARFFVEKRE
jgi:hypothetical protein